MKTVKTRKGTTIQHNKRGYRYRAFKHNRQVYFPLGNDRNTAMKLADEIRDYLVTHSIESAKDKFHPGRHRVSQAECTFAEWRQFLRTDFCARLGLSPRTIDSYVSGVRRILNHAGVDLENFNLLDLRPEWLESYKSHVVRVARDAEEAESKKRGFNSVLMQVKALTTPESHEAHEARGWTLHWGDEVRAVRPYRRCKKIWVQPAESQIKDTHDFVEASNGDFYVACAFALHAGLRRNEIAHVSRDWIQRVGNENRVWVVPAGDFKQKGTAGYTVISDKALERIEQKSLTSDGRFLSRASGRQFQNLINILRTVNPSRSPLHDLRRLFGTYLANRHDLWRAQQYLRHGNPQTTWDSYANSLLSEEAMGWWED